MVHHRIVKAQMDLNGDPMTRYTEGSAPTSLGAFESSDEEFLWEKTIAYRFYSTSFLDDIGLTGDGVSRLMMPNFQPNPVEVDITVKRRLKEDEALFFLWELQELFPDPNVPDLRAAAKFRTLMQVPRA